MRPGRRRARLGKAGRTETEVGAARVGVGDEDVKLLERNLYIRIRIGNEIVCSERVVGGGGNAGFECERAAVWVCACECVGEFVCVCCCQ